MIREAGTSKLKIGDSLPYFSLKGTDGRLYTPAQFSSARVLVVVFSCNHCPYVQAYLPRLDALVREFAPRGVQFLEVNSNDSRSFPTDSFEQMLERSRQQGFLYPYLHDETQVAAKAFDASCTPECFVFDPSRKLTYHGCIDDNFENSGFVEHHYLSDAVAAVLAGISPAPALTPIEGCSIKWRW